MLYSLIFVIIVYSVQFPLNRYLVKIRLLIAQASDARLNVINKLIMGIRTIKTYAWEKPMIESAKKARQLECRKMLRQWGIKGINDGISRNAVVLLWLPVILVKVLSQERLVAAEMFTMMNMMTSLTQITIFYLTLGMNSAA